MKRQIILITLMTTFILGDAIAQNNSRKPRKQQLHNNYETEESTPFEYYENDRDYNNEDTRENFDTPYDAYHQNRGDRENQRYRSRKNIAVEIYYPSHSRKTRKRNSHQRRGVSMIPYLNERPIGKSNYILLAAEDIVLNAPELTQGAIFANDDIHFNRGHFSVHNGKLIAGDDVEIFRGNTIDGRVFAGGEIESRGEINGRTRENSWIGPVSFPALRNFRAGRDNVIVRGQRRNELKPGRYGNISVRPGSVLKLTSGVYFFRQLYVGDNSQLRIDTRRGPVVINVVENIFFGRNAQISSSQGKAGSDQIYFNSLQRRELRIESNAQLMGTIVAPYAKVFGLRDVRFHGTICARDIRFKRGAHLTAHQLKQRR